MPKRAMLLAAGLGTRLAPLTDIWPKCLMPISGRPLLAYWIDNLHRAGYDEMLVNLHHHSYLVDEFLSQKSYAKTVHGVTEPTLLGTAGTLRANASSFVGDAVTVIHADNWCVCDLSDFHNFHMHRRQSGTLITMMTFTTETPENCGIIQCNADGVVTSMQEKHVNPNGNLANAAVYVFEPEIVDWILANPDVTDISSDVLPAFMGRISTWHNEGVHRDIGTIEQLRLAQNDVTGLQDWVTSDLHIPGGDIFKRVQSAI